MASALEGMKLLLGVSGGIAAYKAAELVRRARDSGAEVRVVMTEGAQHFVTPLTFQALSGNPVRCSLWDDSAEAAMGHIELARWADRILIAPASADLIARLANGQADDLLTTLCLASRAPLYLAPAMNVAMWENPATRDNCQRLADRGATLLGPGQGSQACGETGDGRMLEPHQLLEAFDAPQEDPRWYGRRVLVSAGPTYEDIDPVRFLGNRSSGRMGFALAQAAQRLGARTTLIAGPVALSTPENVRRVDVRSARDMHQAVLDNLRDQDVFISAAAVADFRPAVMADCKIKKQGACLNIELARNPDILAELGAMTERPLLIGFAAETRDLIDHARGKLQRKGLDMIVANQVGVAGLGFESDDNCVTIIASDLCQTLGPASKRELSHAILAAIADRWFDTR